MVRDGIFIWAGIFFLITSSLTAQPYQIHEIPLSGLTVNHISQDSLGEIWIGTNIGLYRWTPLSRASRVPEQQLSSSDIREVFHHSQGAWVLTTAGLARLTPDHKLVPHGLRYLRENRIIDIEDDEIGNIWLLGMSQVFLLRPDGSQQVWTLAELGLNSPAALVKNEAGVMAVSGQQGLQLDESGKMEVQIAADHIIATTPQFEYADRSVICSLKNGSLVAALRQNGEVETTVELTKSGKLLFQDHSGNLWLDRREGGLIMIPSSTLEELAEKYFFLQSLDLKQDDRILASSSYENRMTILTHGGRLLWSNRLKVSKEWELAGFQDGAVCQTRHFLLVWQRGRLAIVPLAGGEVRICNIPTLNQVATAGETITIGLDGGRYVALDQMMTVQLAASPNPQDFLLQVAESYSHLLARKVLMLPGGEKIIHTDQELKLMSPSNEVVIPGSFTRLVYWEDDSLLALHQDGKISLLTSSGAELLDCPFLAGNQVNEIWAAPEKNLIWISSQGNLFKVTGIPSLMLGQMADQFQVEPEMSGAIAWSRHLLTISADTAVSVITARELSDPPGELFITCVRLENCMDAWTERRIIPMDSTEFSVQFESTILIEPLSQILEVRVNDLPWQEVPDGRFRMPELPPGNYSLSARIRVGEKILADVEGLIPFSLRPPFYQSWWFLFIGTVLLIGLVWAGFSLYYGESERKRLELQVRDRTRDLDRSVNELRQKNEDLEQFAYIASHDLKSPLRGVIGHLQLFQRKYEKEIDQSGKDSINFAISESKRLYEMVNDLLDFASVGSGKMDKRLVAMNKLLETLRQSILLQRREQPGEIILNNLPQIRVVPTQFEALFRNLIENGLKFNESSHPKVTVTYQETEKQHQFRVIDNGIGMDMKYKEKAFELYGRLNPDYPGTGIGLAICRRVVERHGGLLVLEKSDAEGSVFMISLPTEEGTILA